VWGSIRILERIPAMLRRGSMQPQNPETARAVEESCCRVIESMKKNFVTRCGSTILVSALNGKELFAG
jgi:hypothetical protein